MRMGLSMLVLVCGLAGNPLPTSAAEETKAEAANHLVLQLGSARFAQREAAARALEALGPAAFPALRRAAQSPELEIRLRAANLVRKIQRGLAARQCVAPKRIRLVYKNTPVLDAVADFAERAGCPLQFLGARAALEGRRVTLDTGEVSFWEAFDRFCRAAGLTERAHVPQAVQSLRVLAAAGIGHQLLVGPPLSRFPLLSNEGDERFYLEDGIAPTLPTFLAGAVRLRVLPVASAKVAGETGFWLEVTPECKIPWDGINRLRITRALDDHGQELVQEQPLLLDVPDPAMGAIWQPATRELLMPVRNARVLPVRLRAGKEASRALKSVQGTLGARVQVCEALLTVDDVLKATGQTFKGEEGATLKVEAVRRQEGGVIQLRVAWQPAPLREAVRLGQVVRRPGLVVFSGARQLSPANVQLVDTHGLAFAAIEVDPLPTRPQDVTTPYLITCRPQPGQHEPALLHYTRLRNTIIDMPFQLDDVPLP
jgi:hypothetical protein